MASISNRGPKRFRLFVILWTAMLSLFCIGILWLLLFSVYPNYILRGYHGRFFQNANELANRVAERILPTGSLDFHSAGAKGNRIHVLDPGDPRARPALVEQPLLELRHLTAQEKRVDYYRPAPDVVVFHTTMIPDPYTTYAPAPGDINGLVFHDRQQFRYPVDLGPKRKNEFRVFITGGSVAWGALASGTDHTIAGFLEKSLRERFPRRSIEVIDAAAGAWNSTQERNWIMNRITEYEPDMIISYSGYNDMADVCQYNQNLFDRYWFDGQYYLFAIKQYENYNRGPAVADLVESGLAENGGGRDDCPRQTMKNVEIISAYLEKRNIPYVYVLQPISKGNKTVDALTPKFRAALSALAEGSKDFFFIDHSGLFDRRRDLFLDPVHFGDVGNHLVAQDLLRRLPWKQLFER